MRAIQLSEFSGPAAMELVEIPDPVPGAGEVLVEVARCGVNFADTHTTRNDYLAEQSLPLIPGAEVSGRTPDGRRVAAMLSSGGYAERVAVDKRALVPVPDSVSDDVAAAILLQGITAHALVHRSARLQPGESIVIEAAAGGTGSLAVQIAKRAGARVIGLASTPEKRALVERIGADVTVDSREPDLRSALLAANEGRPVDVVLEMSGGDAFEAALRSLAPFGRLVAFGIASGRQNEVKTGHLMRHSTAVIGFWLVHVMSDRAALAEIVGDLFGALEAGELEVVIGEVRPLSEARAVHETLAGRGTQGKILLDPSR